MKRLPLLVFCLATVLLRAQEDPAKRSLDVYWTDTPPTLDGKMDEACWQTAPVATDFRTFQKPEERPSQQTEVRLCYDATHLYVFWILHEERMDKLAYGPPEDMRDMLDFSGDVAELFIDPGCTRDLYYQLCVSPMGARYDGSRKKSFHWNADWQVTPAIGPDFWAVEAAVPFTALPHKEEYDATPQVGDTWGVQFCRDQARRHEWSQWVPTPRSFHEVDRFGTAVFRGRKDGPAPTAVKRTDSTALRLGTGDFTFRSGGPVDVSWVLSRDGKPVLGKDVRADGELRIPWRISGGGIWDFTIQAKVGGKEVYAGRTWVLLPRVDQLLADIRQQTQAARAQLKGFQHPAAAKLNQRIDALLATAGPALTRMEQADQLDNAAWDGILATVDKLRADWQGLEFDLNLVHFHPRDGRVHPFAVGAAGPYDKIYRDTLYDGKVNGPVQVAAAGGETESCQLVVMPFWQDVDAVQVTAAPLAGRGGTIPADAVSWRRVDYVVLDGVDPDSDIKTEQPDMLMPGSPFTVPAGQLRAVWIDVKCPRGTAAGDYRGSLTVSGGGRQVQIPLTLVAYGWDLPARATLENSFWFGPANFNWGRFYRCGVYGPNPYTPDIYRRQADVLSRYRITPFADDQLTLAPHLTIYHEADGRFTFDFSVWEEFIRIGLEYGGNAYRASHSCNLGTMYLFTEYREVMDRETGEVHRLGEWLKPWQERFKAGEAYWDTHPVYPQYLTQFTDFLRRMGVLDMSTYEIYDEPNSNPRWLDMIRHHKWLRQHVPDLQLMDYGTYPGQRKADKVSLGLMDCWGPHLPSIDADMLATMQARRRDYGEKFWFYTCNEKHDADGNVSPYLYYHRPYIGPRMHAWYAWQMQADGMLIFAINGIPDANVKKDAPEQQWPAAPWHDGRSRGCGTLIYPGPDYEVIPGMRLASIRDGLEDYEYFARLHQLKAYLDPADDADLLARAAAELSIGTDIIDGYYDWTKDAAPLEAKRARLAALIREVEALVAAR